MDAVAFVASLVLGGVFLVAGASKIAMGENWSRQARDLGAPSVVIPMVPWAEIVIGALLISQVARSVVAVAAIAMLVVFTALILLRLSQGKRPACACFGAWSAAPIGPRDVVRNLAFIALAVLVLVV
ncbi:MAG: MauE/DoxX family redox-associated membrane protein [Ilumatobacteraceae bacterium]